MKQYILVVLTCLSLANFAAADSAKDILKSSGVKGGLVVHIGCGDGKLISDLGENAGYIVQGLDTSAAKIEKAKNTIQSKGLTGKVTAKGFDGENLPYIDGSVNLIVVSNEKNRVPSEEIARVLAPLGVALVKKGVKFQAPGFSAKPSGDWVAHGKPWPKDIDEWTHYHHDPQGTMVGDDQVVGPPRGIQWVGGPKWLRNHDFMSSMHCMVSAGGRIFYIIDEGLRNHIFLPSNWTLIARDAFNGTILWEKSLKDWQPNNWPLKSGPGDLPRRMVAVGDKVYVTLGINEPLTCVDAATGRTLKTYKGTKSTEEIILSDGILYLNVQPDRQPVNFKAEATTYKEIRRAESGWAWTPDSPVRRVMAIKADSGKVLWKQDAKIVPLSLTVSDDMVFFHNGDGIVALDRKTGDDCWASRGPAIKSVPTGGSLRVVYTNGVLLFANGTKLAAFGADKGEPLWNGSLQKTSHHCPEDLFIIDGLIWSPNTGRPQENGTHYKVMNVRTGEVEKDFVAENIKGFPMHPRCYPSRATTRFIMTNGMGTEFYEVGGTKVDVNNTVRGSCIYGVMPSNGLLYKPPDSCACYYQSKLEYFCALAPKGAVKKKARNITRLEKGPAFGKIHPSSFNLHPSNSWPMYRGDPSRSGFSSAAVPNKLAKAWEVKLGGKLTQPVVAYGKAFVSAVDSQTLYALNAKNGDEVWKHVAGGRIDSSPTLYKGTVIFGCSDGWVYCLRAEDGALAWRYLVAREEKQIVSYQQLESAWPVHGTVLIQDDRLYALAGRNMFFDGGMRLVKLDPMTGKLLSENIMDENDPETGENLQTLISAKYMPIANEDILSSDGDRLYMLEQNFDMEGKRIQLAPTLPERRGEPAQAGSHLFCQTGLLDDVWFHRSYMIYGKDCGEGWGAYANPRIVAPSGRIMVFDDTKAYAYRSTPLHNMLHPRTRYYLYAADKDPGGVARMSAEEEKKAKGNKGEEDGVKISGHKVHWQLESPPFHVNAMALAAKTLFVAGPPDLADETAMMGYLPGADDEANRQLKAQEEAWLGKRGGILWAVSADTGEKLAEYELDNIPVFDGMSLAEGKVFMSMLDGSVVCYGSK